MPARPAKRRAPWHRIHSIWLALLVVTGLVVVVVGLATSARNKDADSPARSRLTAEVQGGPWLAVKRLRTLTAPIQDEAAAPVSGGALLLGGLNSGDTSQPQVQLVGSHARRALGSLNAPLHDAAAVRLGSKVYLFGGGQSASYNTITAVDPRTGRSQPAGRLPQPRSDLRAATVDHTVYLVGGFTGRAPLSSILAWSPAARGTSGSSAHTVAHLPQPLRYAAVATAGGRVVIAGGITPQGATAQVLVFDPATHSVTHLGTLPAPVSHATAVTLGRFVYVLGGRATNGAPTTEVFAIDSRTGGVSLAGHLPEPLSDSAAVPYAGGILTAGGRTSSGTVRDVLELRPAPRPQEMATSPYLRPGSDPSVLPSNVLVADHMNNRLVEISPQGKIVWSFPKPGDLAPGQTFKVPDDAFFTPDGQHIVATQEDDFVISVIDTASGHITYRYGHPGKPGSKPGYVYNPDDAIMLHDGRIIAADIKNCRLIELKPPLHHTVAQMGTTGYCGHGPPKLFGSPNGAFPLRDGGNVVTEINGDWADVFSRKGPAGDERQPARLHVSLGHQRGQPRRLSDRRLDESRRDHEAHGPRPGAVEL